MLWLDQGLLIIKTAIMSSLEFFFLINSNSVLYQFDQLGRPIKDGRLRAW